MKAVAIAVAGALLLVVFGMWWNEAWIGVPRHDVPAQNATPAPVHAGLDAAAKNATRDTENARIAAAADRAEASPRVRLVVRTSTGQPAAGAEVRYVPPRTQAARIEDQRSYERHGHWEAALVERGSTTITDAQGRLELEADLESNACVRHGDGFAEFALDAAVAARPQDFQVVLCRDVTLRVVVTDDLSRPVPGQPCSVVVSGYSRREGVFHMGTDIGPTNADGVATLRHAFHRLGMDEHLLDGTLTVFADRPRRRGTIVLAEWRSPIATLLPETRAALVVPAGGTIVVEATDATGAPFVGSIQLAEEDQGASESGQCAGEYSFRNVPCGRRWVVSLASGSTQAETTIVGPRQPSDVVRLAMRAPLHRWVLRCRIVRADGSPLEGAEVTVGSPALAAPRTFGSGGKGIVDAVVETLPGTRDLAPMRVRIQHPLCAPREFLVERPLPPGSTDLGEWVVEAPARETVLARVRLSATEPWHQERAVVALFTKDAQGSLDAHPTITRRDGDLFELRGCPPAAPLWLYCRAPEFAPLPPTPVAVGEQRDVTMQRAASLQIAVQMPDIPNGALECELLRATEAEPRCSSPDEQDIATWYELPPDTYHLQVKVRGRILHEERAVLVLPGKNVWPVDGSRLQLGHVAKALAIVARSDADGSLLTPDVLVVAPHAQELPADVKHAVRDDGWVLAAEPPSDVLVRNFGYVPVRLPRVTDDATLTMQRCTDLEFVDDGIAWDAVRVRIVADAVTDPLLRAFDLHPHRIEFEVTDDNELVFAPGTVLDLTPVLADKPGATVRVVVGRESPQRVAFR